jgi:hypothetical protein
MAMDSAICENWEEAVQKLEECILKVDDNDEGQNTIIKAAMLALLFRIVKSNDAPLRALQLVIDQHGTECITQVDSMGQTPLHAAIGAGERIDFVNKLVEVYPQGVTVVDNEYQTPLDMLSRKIIMSEELKKYADPSDSGDEPDNTDELWECAHIMLVALGPKALPRDEPFLHAVVHAKSDCPVSIRDRAFSRYKYQMIQKDSAGNLPIHIEASKPIEEDDEWEDLLPDLISPEAAATKNGVDKFPLEVAIQSGRTWRAGISDLLAAFPAAVESLNFHLGLYPVLYGRVDHDTLYQLVMLKPEFLKR